MRRNTILIEIFIALLAFAFVFPIILIFVTSFKPDAEIIHFESILPHHWTLDNFKEILASPVEIPIFRWFFNSLLISTSCTFVVLTVTSMAAYALARLNLPGRKQFFAVIIATLMVPGQILLIPVYFTLDFIGWLDNPLALIVPAGSSAFGVFLLHQFFKGLPKELEEAAVIDGCSVFRIYWHIILPLSKPALATLGIFTFIGSWNSFMAPLVFMDSVDKYTLPVGIALFQSSYSSEYGLTIAASLICTFPVIIAFLFFQKHIIKGISLSGLKS